MGLLITECLGCDVSNFLTIREKKRGCELPLQSSGWDCQVPMQGVPGTGTRREALQGVWRCFLQGGQLGDRREEELQALSDEKQREAGGLQSIGSQRIKHG